MIISLYAGKHPYDLFSKHGAFDAKAQEEPALLWQGDSGGTGRRGQGGSPAEGHITWGNKLGQHWEMF